MPFLILISPEENLKVEVEGCLGALSPRPTLMRVDSFPEFDLCLESLSDVKAVLLDVAAFAPPANFPLPLLLLGPAENTAGYPSVNRPLYPESLSFAIDELLSTPIQPPADTNDTASAQLAFVSALLHEVIHDLNNQFTTLRGNIPFLMEEYPNDDGSLKDIFHATERGAALLHLLEGLDPDTRPDPESFLYESLLKDFHHFGMKMVPVLTMQDPSPAIKLTALRGDPLLLCQLLLQVLWCYRSQTSALHVSHHLRDKTLELCMSPQEPLTDPEQLSTQLQVYSTQRFPGQISLRNEGFSLQFSLPREQST
ncbi:hypothetical protein P0Y35_00655 [Kiritimatiellaeota bacterium B1221]|nr:hypothetical protein [Kiritimatiellaeota bacterium B1221]